MVRAVPYDGTDSLYGLFTKEEKMWNPPSPSEVARRMDQDLAARRNAAPKTVKSRIRVQLSRPLTWAEKESLETDNVDPHLRKIDGKRNGAFKIWVSPNFEHVWAEADFGSRLLFEVVAAALEHNYVNVFPRAVRTFHEYNGE